MMYLDLRSYSRMVRLALRERDPRGRRITRMVVFLVIPIAWTLHAVCFALDRVFFPGLRKVEVKEPVFLIGHARSGTTLLHRLLTSDRDRFSCFLAYEMFFPSLLEKKLIRLLGRFDQRFLGSRIKRSLTAREDRTLAKTRDIHPTGLWSPEEDDFVLTCSCASGFWIAMFPYMDQLDFYYVDKRPQRRRRRLMGFYRECVLRQLYLNGAHRTHCSKNPTFSGRVESLIETFPDARFVVLMRDPREAIPSLLKLMLSSWRAMGWKRERTQESLQILARQSVHTYLYPLEVLPRHPETRWAIVDYRDLVADPKAAVEGVYRELGIEMTPEFAALLEQQGKRARAHKSSHRYGLEEFGLNAAQMEEEMHDLFERFGWDRSAPGNVPDSTSASGG
jgi:omega-hydroxy-beta-dihydromenaquinone-9 sulfotransferase